MDRNRTLRDRVTEVTANQVKASIGRGDWLNDNVSFSHCYKLGNARTVNKAQNLFYQLVPPHRLQRKVDQKIMDFNILIANLLSYREHQKPISISLSPNNYVRHRYNKASPFTIELVKLLHKNGYIDMKKGHNADNPRLTRIWPFQKFLDHFKTTPNPDYEPIELVNLRDSNKNDIDYEDTNETLRIRRILRNANIINRKSMVGINTIWGFEKINTDLHAVFSNSSFEQGGRLYTGKEGYQSLKSGAGGRKDITIDGIATIELDFSGLHPRLLYARKGIKYEGDPYACLPSKLRGFSKCILLALLNTESIGRVINYGYQEYNTDDELFITLKELNTNPKEVIEIFCKEHSDIAEYFGKGTGMELMNLDSKIALDVVEHFTSREIPILAIHDSFIVQEDFQTELKTVMQEAYGRHSGGFYCPIK